MLLNEFEERLLRNTTLALSFAFVSRRARQETSSCDSSRLLKCLSKTLDRRAESFPRCTTGNPTAPLNFLPRITFQTTEDDIVRDFIAASKDLR